MAEEKEPERKKLSLQGNKKLSLGSGQDLVKSNRSNNIPGMRSVQIETRRKRFSRGNLNKSLNIESENDKSKQITSQTNLTEREREARMNALRQGLQDIETKTNSDKFLSREEIDINSKPNVSDQSKNKTNLDKIKKPDNTQITSDVLQTTKENVDYDKIKKQNEFKFVNDDVELDKKKLKLKPKAFPKLNNIEMLLYQIV